MKVIIRRDKQTKKIIGDFGEYERLNKQGETEADIYSRVEAFNKQKFHGSIAEIVELDEIAEFYAKRADPYLGVPDDISKRLRDIASRITDIADEIEEKARNCE